MPLHLQIFQDRTNATLHVFCPDRSSVVSTFENYLPVSSGHDISHISSNLSPDSPAELSWNKLGYDYYAFLPKHRSFEGHLLAPLNHHKPTTGQRDGRWFVDETTRDLWRSLDMKFTASIKVLGDDLLVELDHHEPSKAAAYGFQSGHTSRRNLEVSLRASRHAFIHRLAYLVYLISCRYRWDTPDLCDQPWWKEFVAKCGRTWVDSVWDVVCRQWDARNFIGVAVRPSDASVKWLWKALCFGVPIWVSFPEPGCYRKQEGAPTMSRWEPDQKQVAEGRRALIVKITPQTAAPPHTPPAAPPHGPPAVLPENAQWCESWEEFFRKRDEDYSQRLREASDREKQVWDSRAANAKRFQAPGKGIAVYIWETCESGGFFRILQTRHEATNDWDFYFKEALVYSPYHNSWDHCPFKWPPAVRSGAPDDTDSDDGYVGEFWYPEPDLPATLPEDTPSPLDFMYHRYGFLSAQPTTPAQVVLPFDIESANRIVGLDTRDDNASFRHLNSFISSFLQGQQPAGHCDLSFESPPEERFSPSGKTSIYNTVFQSNFPQLSTEPVFTLINVPNNSQLVVIHDSLSVLQCMRAKNSLQLTTAVHYLLHNGCRFTLLYPHTRDPSPFGFITFPIRDTDWKPNADDYKAYISRLKTFFLERPHVVAAALSRGGIAWRIAREVLGMDSAVDAILGVYPEVGSSVNTRQGRYWFHEPHEGEWFYLVGGYELLTGLWYFFGILYCADLSREGRTEAGPFMVAKGHCLGGQWY
jgi:hypothetical protein